VVVALAHALLEDNCADSALGRAAAEIIAAGCCIGSAGFVIKQVSGMAGAGVGDALSTASGRCGLAGGLSVVLSGSLLLSVALSGVGVQLLTCHKLGPPVPTPVNGDRGGKKKGPAEMARSPNSCHTPTLIPTHCLTLTNPVAASLALRAAAVACAAVACAAVACGLPSSLSSRFRTASTQVRSLCELLEQNVQKNGDPDTRWGHPQPRAGHLHYRLSV